MRLYIVQHGDAVPKDVDPDRPLSERGRRDIERLRDFLTGHDVQVSRILHSGKTRAQETAEILRPLLERSGRIQASEGLAPNDSPEGLLSRFRDVNENALIASHMPFVARTVSQALTGGMDLELLEFKPGSIAGIERGDDASWRLFLFLRPDYL